MAGRDGYSGSSLEAYANQLGNPAAPEGAHQAVRAERGYVTGDPAFENSSLGRYASESGLTAQSGSWFTGRNVEGTNNGWSTTFTEKFIAGQDQAAAEGRLGSYFTDAAATGATGVVTWDHTGDDGTEYHFGDVYEDGKKVANLYDPNAGGFDKDTANLMMSAWVLDGTQQARVFSDSDRLGALDRAVSEVRESNRVNIPKALAAAELQGKIDERAEDFNEGIVDEAIVGGGAAGGAAVGAGTGAAIGSIVPGAGTAIGAAVGGAVGGALGGLGAWMNKDELTEKAARAYEITALANREEGRGAALTTGLQEWAGFSMGLTTPVTNLTHGLVELTGENEVGDGEGAFYAVDEHGDSTRPRWAKPLSLGATLIDGVAQFASPLARGIYTAQMGATIGGEVGTLALTGGKMFDPREGGFDNIFTDDDGDFDPVSAAAGILKIGVDAVQLGGLRGLARTTQRTGDEARALTQPSEAAGFKFTFDEAGNVVDKKVNWLTMLAPSEAIGAANAARQARVAAWKRATEGGSATVTADDFYRAATSLATGSNRLKIAMVNGFGEGTEEFVQGILEPIALDGDIDVSELVDAYLMGAAGGVGMNLGATAGAATRDDKLKAQAYVMETIRRGGEEPGPEEWESIWGEANETQKRVMATRSKTDLKMVQQALARMTEDHTASLVASEPDVLKANDAKRTKLEKELKSDTWHTDTYHVMTAQLSAGEMDVPAEAVEASALTIARLIEDRYRGMELQERTLRARLDAVAEPSAEDIAERNDLELVRAVGAHLSRELVTRINQIYDENTDDATAEALVAELNALLTGWFTQTRDVVVPPGAEGVSQERLRRAAAKFITLLHSREPKLDSGSYLTLLPQASWDLTRDESDNVLRLNVDMLAAINGDFDGDKLRNEYQLILSDERFTQARAGELLGGRGREIDVVGQAFDPQLAMAVAAGLTDRAGDLHNEATATMAAIEAELTDRYGRLMSPAALARVFARFRTAVLATDPEEAAGARSELLNALAHEAGGAITELGRTELRNEWLWAAKMVRHHFEAYQTTYVRMRARDRGPSAQRPVADIDTPDGVNRRKDAAVSDAQTLSLFAVGNSLFRKFQKIHYSFYGSRVLKAAGAERADLFEMAALYAELSRGVTRTEMDLVDAPDQISARVLAMLERLVVSAMSDPAIRGSFDPATAAAILANVKVKDVRLVDGQPQQIDDQEISLAQLLLRRALDADREEHKLTFDTDEKLKSKHARLRAMTFPNTEGNPNAERAFIEVFKATPFMESLGGVTGWLAPHTTPEQWLRDYVSLDPHGRRDQERLFKNHPDYLDREQKQNLPYTMSEALNRSITPYRSMMDALLAVGRHELTFEPDTPIEKAADAFGGARAELSKAAADALVDAHTQVRQALAAFRKTRNRTSKDRAGELELVRELFRTNPVTARLVLDLVPDADANALFESRDGELYVTPWLYETFAIEDPKEAVFHYWSNLMLTKWESLRQQGLENRRYHELNSRFLRLLYRLAAEPGQLHLELLIRKMRGDEAFKDLDQFFLWLNRTPGFRGEQAVLLPFNDDVVDFEADASGGWTTERAGTDLRAAITALRNSAEQMRTTVEFREAKAATDKILRDGIRRALAGDPDGDYEALRKFEKALQVSLVLPRGFAPSAMLALTNGAMTGFSPHSTDKGVPPDTYAGLGEFQALMDAFAFVPGLERTMELLTAHSISAMESNVGDLGKHAGTAMDAHGRQIEWAQLTVGEALDMLDNPATEPLALTLLTPQALDVVNGKLVERQLMDSSLMDLLAGEAYTDLFNLEGAGALNNAMRYLSVLQSRSNAEGGNFDVMRYVNALAITRMSGLGKESTPEDRDRITTQTYLDVARALQMVGQVQATPEMRGGETLTELRKAAVTLLRNDAAKRKLPGFTEKQDDGTEQVVKGWVEQMLADLDAQQLEQHQEAEALYEGAELQRQLDAIDAGYEVNAARVRALLEDDLTTAVVNKFAVSGDPHADALAHAQIVEYAMAHASPQRMQESAEIWQKLANQRFNGQAPDLEAGEWDQLSRSVMGLFLLDQVLQVASHVSIPPFGKGDPTVSEARFHKYFDPAYAFIATDLLGDDSTMAAAAGWLHVTAEQPRALLSIEQMTSTLKRTVLNDKDLGPWTPGQMAQIIADQERMDSSPVAGATAAAGNGPKRWAAVAYATRRTGKVPPPELLTTAVLDSSLLDADASVFSEIGVTPAGSTEEISMPVAQLDNRFVAAIRVNGTEISLEAENLGFVWQGEPSPTGYRYISLERLRPILRRLTVSGDATVEIDFFHPDSRPADPEWANNVYFDGMAHSLLPDGAESLIAAFWSANAGRIAEDTQLPLDAGKKGVLALTPFTRPDPAKVAAAEAHWIERGDMAAMLRAKTELLLAGDDTLTASDYNALYKMLGLQHIVVGIREGRRAAMTASEVIAAHAADPAAPLPLEGARLVKLSPDVLRTMLGETGDQGVARFFEDEFLLNPDQVAEFTQVTDAMAGRFPGWFAPTGAPGDTTLANVGRSRTLTVRATLTESERNARQERLEFLDAHAAEVRAARYTKFRGASDALNGYVATLQAAVGSISAERNDFGFMDAGIPIAARNTAVGASHTRKLLGKLQSIVKLDDYNRGWRVVDDGTPSLTPDRSVLTLETLNDDRELEHRVVKDDFALLELNTFQRFTDPEVNLGRVEKALRYLTGTGATIALGSGDGRGDMVRYAAQYLREHGYSRVEGSQHLFAPSELVDQTQNEKAYASTLLETRTLRPAKTAVTFLAKDPVGTTENSAIPNRKSRKLRDRKLVNNLLRSSGIGHYNLPLDTGGDSNLYADTLAHLRTITDPARTRHRAKLLEMGGTDPDRLMPLADALDRFHARITRSASLVPEEGEQLEVGDIIPFVNTDGKVILYRHGFEPPKVTDLPKLFKNNEMNVVVGKSKPDAEATANTGVIRRIEDAPGYGKRILLEVPLQLAGDKVQLEWNGMKYVLTPGSEKLDRFLDVPVFGNGTRIDLLADYTSAAAKEAYEGLVTGYRNALAFFQFDFTEDLVRFFYPDQANRPPQAEILVYSLLTELSSREDLKIPQADAVILSKAHRAVADTLAGFAEIAGPDPDWVDRLGVEQDATTQIARAVITYLLTHGAHPNNVLRSAGFSHPRADNDAVETRLVPGLFADLLDQGVTSAVHAELIDRFDTQLSSLPGGAGMRLRKDWTVEIYDGQGNSLEGFLQFGEIHSTGDNPVLNAAADARATKSGVSPHNALASALSVGAITSSRGAKKFRAFARSFAKGGGVVKPGTEGESMWQMLTALPEEKDLTLAGWRRETPAETVRRALARQELVGFYTPLDDENWTDQERAQYEAQVAKILGRLNLYGSQRAMVDTWVRMHLGRPSNRDADGHDPGQIGGRDAVDVAKKIWRNVNAHQLPTAGAEVPLLDVNHLTVIYTANRHRTDGWSPAVAQDADSSARARSWDAWVEVSFGTAFGLTKDDTGQVPEPRFRQMYLLAVDGLMHGYQGANSATRYLPVSSDVLRQQQLMDPVTSQMLVSISEDENLLATDATLFHTTQATLEEVIGGQRIYAPGRGDFDPASARGRQDARVDAWHRESNVPRQRGQKISDVRAAGQTFLGYTTDTHAFWRSAHNLRVGNTLLNPLLILSAPLEAYWRRTVDTFADALSGEATGRLGRLQSRTGEALADTKIGTVAQWLGVETTYTVEEQDRIEKLVDALSTLPEFKALVYRELMHQYPSIPGIGKVEKWLEAYAKFGARLQDPAIGMRPKDLARIYVKTAMRRIATDPTGENVYSTQQLLTQLARNPEWLRGQDLETHNMAIASIANIRSLKPSVLSLATRGIVEPLAGSKGLGRNTAGNMLKLLTTFQNFWANSFINLTGMQGVADFAAFHLDGRKKSKLIRRFQAGLAGETFVPDEDERFDMSEVIEGMDLADSFIRGGVTHTSLFMFGMMAGEFGLGGEDEEERWRRRAAELQGAGFVHDPRSLANDFRTKGAIFLEWLPDGLESWFKVDPNDPNSPGIAQMNWTMRYFMSPILGFERFYRTGDFSEVIHGFGDAIGSHPIVNSSLWNETVDTAAELHSASNEAVEKGDMPQAAHLLITAVGTFERMLLENATVNMIYTGVDRYDRDPYKLPARDSDGNLQRDVRNNPYQTNSALTDYVDDNGTPNDPSDDMVKQEYVDRDGAGATFRSFTENRFGLAFLGSLFTGVTGGGFTGSDMFRFNMPVKTRAVELAPGDQGELTANILAAFQGANVLSAQDGGPITVRLTEGEWAQKIKNEIEAAGQRWDANEVQKLAEQLAAQEPLAEMSRIDAAGREHLTDAGARAVFEGLRRGATTLGTAPLNGVYMTADQRDQIRDDLIRELVQEGVDLGLNKDQATWRMRRIMFGTGTEADTPALIDLLYTDQIPWSDTLEYNQLNTTYVTGPQGFPMSTGFTRGGLLAAFGQPLMRPWQPKDTGLDVDARMNSVDSVAGINTGLRALEPRPASWEIPMVEEEIRKAAEKVVDALKDLDFTPSAPYAKKGSGYGGYSRGGRGGYSSGGGYYSNPYKLYALPGNRVPYGNSIPFINTSNPIIRRADVRRERVWSERGRLNQWQ